MKTDLFKMMSVILVGAFCLVTCTVLAAKDPKPGKKTNVPAKKLPVDVLSKMKIKNIEFGFNKTTIPDNAYSNLKNVAKLMTDNNASLKLGGYADSKGGYVYNWMLSKARAEAVKVFLAQNGADSTRIAATEYGYTHPIATNKTPEGRKKNRRVEVRFAN